MFKTTFKIIATFFFTLMLSVSGAQASGKMEVPLGQEVTLQADTLNVGSNYKWVVKKEGDIVATISGNIFTYTFDQQGEYAVNLSSTDNAGNTQNTTVMIMVGGRYSKPATEENVFDVPLAAKLTTLPSADQQGVVTLLGESGRVAFDIDYRPDVLEFRLDRNIFEDSDGNGIPDDDIDNEADPSYLRAGLWQTTYQSTQDQITAQLTVVNSAGKSAKSQVVIRFNNPTASQGNVLAVLDTLPVTNASDNKIYVYGDQAKVAFYARRSQGQVLEYRIDRNIFEDSDGNGNPSDDIDNRNDDSFKTGDVWVTEYQKTDQKMIAQLIVVSVGGVGSRIQREVVFTQAPPTQSGTDGAGVITLTSDKDFVQKGDPITFSVNGLTQSLDSYTFDWDFNGDGRFDQTTEGVNTTSFIYDVPGVQQVAVQVKDKDGNQATFAKEIQVKDIQATKANFEYALDGLKVTFTNASTAAASLQDQNLSYKWSFGDTDEANYTAQKDQTTLENPTYTYKEAGTYIVAFTITDAAGQTDTKTTELVVGGGSTEQPSETPASGSLLGKILKIILYVVLGLVVLILLGLVSMLAYLKVKHPDLVFEELIDELKLKILSFLGAEDVIEPEEDKSNIPGMTGGVVPPYKPQQKTVPAPKPSESKPEPKPEPKPAEPDLSKSNAPTPDWLKNEPSSKNEVIEGEVLEKKPEPPKAPLTSNAAPESSEKSPQEAPKNDQDLSKSNGPVPDWLKDA